MDIFLRIGGSILAVGCNHFYFTSDSCVLVFDRLAFFTIGDEREKEKREESC